MMFSTPKIVESQQKSQSVPVRITEYLYGLFTFISLIFMVN